MISSFANPQKFMAISAWLMPAFAALAVVLFAIGVSLGLWFSPADYQQGESVRIMYVHVPAAWWSMAIYAMLALASFVFLVWRHTLADVAARAAAPIGAAYAGLCLVTGSLWGRPTWGTWWEWDARLTSMLVLFLTFLGYIALRAALDDEDKASRLGAILALAGAINLPVVHFSVEWWSTLHQPSSIIREGGSSIHPSMMAPLFTMAGAYAAAFAVLLLAGMRAEIYRRRATAAARKRARGT
ncbi:MAG: heme ABC transporter permease CcmC [Caulobacterales bacterium]